MYAPSTYLFWGMILAIVALSLGSGGANFLAPGVGPNKRAALLLFGMGALIIVFCEVSYVMSHQDGEDQVAGTFRYLSYGKAAAIVIEKDDGTMFRMPWIRYARFPARTGDRIEARILHFSRRILHVEVTSPAKPTWQFTSKYPEDSFNFVFAGAGVFLWVMGGVVWFRPDRLRA